MMLALGLFVFQRQSLPYQNMQRSMGYRWPTNSRVGQRPGRQFMGPDEERVVLSGVLLPEITGGKVSLLALEVMAAQGRAWPLIGGDGSIYGMFVVNGVTTVSTEFFADGSPRRIEFSVTLLRIDHSLISLFGDLASQAGDIFDGLLDLSGEVAP